MRNLLIRLRSDAGNIDPGSAALAVIVTLAVLWLAVHR